MKAYAAASDGDGEQVWTKPTRTWPRCTIRPMFRDRRWTIVTSHAERLGWFLVMISLSEMGSACTTRPAGAPSDASLDGNPGGGSGGLRSTGGNGGGAGGAVSTGGTTWVPDPDHPTVEFPIPGTLAAAHDITVGPDGNLWFTENVGHKIGRITTDGAISEFDILTTFRAPESITQGTDGHLWFTEPLDGKIGRISTDGSITQFPVPSPYSPISIVSGPDGALWFTEMTKIGRITTDGAVRTYDIGSGTSARDLAEIVVGPDGNLWFADAANVVGRLSTDGQVTEFPNARGPSGITVGSDNNLWFTEYDRNKIGCMNVTGTVTEFDIPSPGLHPGDIALGTDGYFWFTEDRGIGRISPSGAITEFGLPCLAPHAITAGPDGNLWIACLKSIVRFTP